MDLSTTQKQQGTNIQHDLRLSPHQQRLLFAALNSNKSSSLDLTTNSSTSGNDMSSMGFTESPLRESPGSGALGGFDDSPFIDYDYEFDVDGTFDYDINNGTQAQMIGTLPGTTSPSDGDAETGHEKRSHPDDDEDDDEGGGKRREGDDKTSKKPGRKPLTSEPTSKRKAQNRAAQRAFRERKEKHLKDLETKVQDLQKASESANHENSILRSQIEKMSTELREYKKRLALQNGGRASSFGSSIPPYLANGAFGGNGVNNPNNLNFQFEFPKFGAIGAPSAMKSTNKDTSKSYPTPDRSNSSPMPTLQRGSSHDSNPQSKFNQDDMSSLSGLFSPSILDSVNKSNSIDYISQPESNESRTDSIGGQTSTGHNTSYSSPSVSSNSQNGQGPSSSCGTSPEPSLQSPSTLATGDFGLTTIGEEHQCTNTNEGESSFCEKLNMACGNPNNPIPRVMSKTGIAPGVADSFDVNGIDWFAQQNNNSFDPVLFGDYREPQNNVLSGTTFDDSFFNSALDIPDFSSPFNIEPSPAATTTALTSAPHKSLVEQIDEKQNEEEEVVPGDDRENMLDCNKMWSAIQNCPKVQSGEFDLDGLCTQLRQQAKCSETGAVVDRKDFNQILSEYVAKDKAAEAAAASTGTQKA